ncbi:hypothetical protein UT300005_00200 [Clostridium sp. CTA-5]
MYDKADIGVELDICKPGMLYYWQVNRKDEQEQLETSTSNVPEVSSSQTTSPILDNSAEDSYEYPADYS